MRIAFFSEVYWPMVSGVSLTLSRTVAALEARGHSVRVYSVAYPLPEGGEWPDNLHRSPGVDLPIYRDVRWGLPSARRIAADIDAFRPDIIHLATEFAMGRAGLVQARRLGLPVVASAHTDYEAYAARYGLAWAVPAGWRYLRWFYDQAETVLAPSSIYERHLNRRGIHHTGIWSRGVDTDRFSPAYRNEELRASWGAGPDTPVVIHVGRLAVEKNIPVLLEAWRSLAPVRGDARLVLTGQGPVAGQIRELADASVILTGTLTGRELSAAYASADVFAMPSTTETFGNVLLEAMASGLPSVVARAGGVLDFAEHPVNALLVAPDDAIDFAEGLATLLENRQIRSSLAAGARSTAMQRSWNAVFDRLIDDYRRVAGPVRLAA